MREVQQQHLDILPMTVEEVTPEWLTTVLQSRHPGVVVTECRVRDVLWGSATKVILEVAYNAEGVRAGLPTRLCVKGGFHAGLRELVGDAYVLEAVFYGRIAPALSLSVPKTFYEAACGERRQAVLLMEDLSARDVRFGKPTVPYTPEQVMHGLELQAQWHGRSWNDHTLVRQGLIKRGNPQLRQFMGTFLSPQHWDTHISKPKAATVEGGLRNLEIVRESFSRLWAYDDAATPCFLHGDTHIGNTYLEPSGHVRFLDWQTVMLAPWSHDVAQFVAGSLSPEDRRAFEKDLLARYLDRLAHHGGARISFGDAWTDYVRHILHGFLWVMTPEEMQPDAYVTAMTERFAAAAAELGTLEALR